MLPISFKEAGKLDTANMLFKLEDAKYVAEYRSQNVQLSTSLERKSEQIIDNSNAWEQFLVHANIVKA